MLQYEKDYERQQLSNNRIARTWTTWLPPGARCVSPWLRYSHAAGNWKRSSISTVKPTVHTNTSRKRSFSKTLSKRDEPYLNSYYKNGNTFETCLYFPMGVTKFFIRNVLTLNFCILIELQTNCHRRIGEQLFRHCELLRSLTSETENQSLILPSFVIHQIFSSRDWIHPAKPEKYPTHNAQFSYYSCWKKFKGNNKRKGQ